MRNILKKSLFLMTMVVCSATMFAETFTASEINSATTKSGITVSQNSCSLETQQICKENSKGVKESIIKCGNTASNVDEKYVEIKATSDISALRVRATTNNSSAKNMAFLYWGDVTPTVDNVSSAALVSFGSYDGACDANYVDVNIPSGTRVIRIYRQVKNFNGTGSEKNKTYGEGTTFHMAQVEVTAGPAPASTDATLKSIVYGGDLTPIPNFSADKLNYEVELPANYVGGAPSVQATPNDTKATVSITQAPTLPGTAKIDVTAEDGTTKLQYTVTFTKASAAPKVLTATWANIQGTAVIDQVNLTITGKVKNGTSLIAIEPTFTGNNIKTWTPVGAQNFSNGPVTYDFTSATADMTSYTVTITEAPAVSTDATLKSLTYGGTSVPNFSTSTYVYNIELTAGIKTPPTIAATPNDSKATMDITQAKSVPGSGKVVVTAEDGVTTLTYTINYTVQVPPSGLSIHVPEIYEAKELAGGYNTPLTVFNNREYEVYYTERTADGDFPTFSTTLASEGKSTGISNSSSKTKNEGREGDKWFEGTITSHSECKNAADQDEFDFETKMIREHRLGATDTYQFHVQGFDQFSLWGMDKKLDPKNGNQVFVVKVDGVEQPTDASLYNTSAYTVRRYDISTAEHLIEISTTCSGSNTCYMGGFSLRVAQEPRTRYLKGNDSTQVVLQTTAIRPITYVTKYNNIPGAMTRLVWLGQQATDIDLQKVPGDITDTLLVSGIANCPVGTYNYEVRAYYNGQMTNSVAGSFKVASDIQATSDLKVKVYQGEEMDQITFRYYALSANDVHLNWTGATPTGITGSGNNGKYFIGGTPQTTGIFPFEVSVTGADTIIKGTITVETLDYGDNAVLYLYKNNSAYEQDAVYKYLDNGGNWKLITRKAKEDGLRPEAQYANYKWVLVSEDVDANNMEVMAVIRGGAKLPVLNLKGFAYSSDRLAWGEPDNGAIDSTATKIKGTYLHVQHANHPIYTAKMNYLKDGDSIQILSDYETKGIMPINVDYPNSYCLGTAYTRNIEDYYQAGELQTALHEIPAKLHGGYKYICLPLAGPVTLSNMGKSLIDGIVAYLTSPTDAGITLPELQINRFTVNSFNAKINQQNNTILLRMPQEEYDNLETAQPIIELADPNTHVVPSVEPSIDLRYAIYIPTTFVVTDYINREAYDLTIELYDPQGIEQTYEAGMWVNVYDIYGRKVATTNEDIYTMELPQGMYIIMMENGQSLKILRQ